MKFDQKQRFSFRKYKSVGLASAIVGLSILGATGALNDVPGLNTMFGVETVQAATIGETTPVSVTFRPTEGTLLDTNGLNTTTTVTATFDGKNWNYYVSPPQGYSLVDSPSYSVPERPSSVSVEVYKAHRDSGGNDTNSSDGSATEDMHYGTGEVGNRRTESYESTEKTYVKDETREKGQPDIKEGGKKGLREITRNYNLSYGSSGTEFSETVKIIREATPSIIKVAAKDKVETTTTPSVKKYVKDSTRDRGSEDIVTQGRDGSTTIRVAFY